MNVNLVALGLVLAAGSRGRAPTPAWTTAVSAHHPPYPQARFITRVGLSSTSADDADARAKENVALQISTRLESENSSVQKYTKQAGNNETRPHRPSGRGRLARGRPSPA